VTDQAPDTFSYSDLLQPDDYAVQQRQEALVRELEWRQFARAALDYIKDEPCDCDPGGWAGAEHMDATQCHRCQLLAMGRRLVGEAS